MSHLTRAQVFGDWAPGKDAKPEEVLKAVELQERLVTEFNSRGIKPDDAKILRDVAVASGIESAVALADRLKAQAPAPAPTPEPAPAPAPAIQVAGPASVPVGAKPPSDTPTTGKFNPLSKLVFDPVAGPTLDMTAVGRELADRYFKS